MSEIGVQNEGHVRTITLNRPEKKNALSDSLAWGIIGAIEQAALDAYNAEKTRMVDRRREEDTALEEPRAAKRPCPTRTES